MNTSPPSISQFVLKIAGHCNLNCSYCYVYNKADASWKTRPALMSDEVFESTLDRIRRHCVQSGQSSVRVTFHGGEPCLVRVEKFDRWCTRIREELKGIATVDLGIQTNGTLIDTAWGEVFRHQDVDVGISMDGPKKLHDAFRLDHQGRGSYDKVERGLRVLQDAEVSYGIMAVIPFGSDPLPVHRHFVSLGCTTITYILPNYSHDTIGPIRQVFGESPCADFLIPIFDEWWFNGTMDVCVRDLHNMARIILGGSSAIETFGNTPPLYAFVETDGAIEGLDNLYVCADGITKIGLNVRESDFHEILQSDSMHRTAIFEGMPLPTACRTCPEQETCAGGYLPHRYSAARGFDNPSVWCADFQKLFAHLRSRLNVTIEETQSRRAALRRIAVQP